jgi:hypothetical protein
MRAATFAQRAIQKRNVAKSSGFDLIVIKNVQRKRHLVARAGFNKVINEECKIW